MLHDVKEYPVAAFCVWGDSQQTNSTIESLAKSPFNFYLAGSRYFECARKDSDWDFYVQHSEEADAFLSGLGFNMKGKKTERAYADAWNNTVFVLEWGNIHVQLLGDVEIQRKTRDLIFTTQAAEHLVADRDKRREMWTAAQTAVRKGSKVSLADVDDLLPF